MKAGDKLRVTRRIKSVISNNTLEPGEIIVITNIDPDLSDPSDPLYNIITADGNHWTLLPEEISAFTEPYNTDWL